jgi:hypothetical protein
VVRYAFIHLPKAAGFSFWHGFRSLFGPDEVSPHFRPQEVDPAMQRFRVIAGHITARDLRHFPDRLWLTTLREPIDRVLSNYCFQRDMGAPSHATTILARGNNIGDFVRLPLDQIISIASNRMVRQLGADVFDMSPDLGAALMGAKETLKRCAWVGFQEDLDIASLQNVPGLSGFSLPRARVNPSRDPVAALAPDTRAAIAAMNAYDIELFEWAKETLRTPRS